MKIKKLISITCISMLLASLSMQVKAAPASGAFYSIIGKITQMNKRKMTVSDNVIRISPTVKVRNMNNALVKFSTVKTGDFVGLSVVTINDRQLVDTITLLP